MSGGGGGVDIWIQGFAPGTDPVRALVRVFGIDEARAVAIQQTVPRAVRRNAPPADAEAIAAALREIGAKVELRPHRGDARTSGAAQPRPSLSPVEPVASVSVASASVASASVASASRASVGGALRPSVSEAALPLPDDGPRPSARAAPSSSEGLELAFDPEHERERAARVAKTNVRPIHQVSLPPAPAIAASPPESSRPSISFSLPGWLRGAGCVSSFGLLWFLLRLGRCAWVVADAASPPSPSELAALEAQSRASVLADAVDLDAFLARPNAMLGRDMDRNAGFAARLRSLGATRVLVTDVARVSGGDVGLTLVVELPPSVATRRRVLLEIERYYANGAPVAASDVELPPADERYEFVDLE